MKRELLFSVTKKDLKISYFSGSGGGGQHRNKHKNCVRLQHPASKIMVTGQSHKERPSNMKEAFINLTTHPKFKIWLAGKTQEVLSGKTLEKKVDELMNEENLKIEGKDENGRWEDLNSE